MSDSIRELAEQRRRRFQALPAELKPKVTVCPHCDEPTYLRELCPETGQFHELERKTLVGGAIVQGRFITSSELMGAIDRTRVKWVASRTQLVRADGQSLNIFQSFSAQVAWGLQRYGILYGRYDGATQVVEVHAIYEPEQHGNQYGIEPIPDPRVRMVDRIAEGLGLRRVGAICTHAARDPNELVVTARELLLCAREQSLHGDECVLLTVAPNVTDGVVECQAWQVSPQCVHLFRLGMLHEPGMMPQGGGSGVVPLQGHAAPYLAEPQKARMITSRVPLEVAQEDMDGKGHRHCVTKEPCSQIDTRWFTSYIAVQQFTSEVVRGGFMRISRPGMSPPTMRNLRNYMTDPRRAGETFAEKIADFHVLIYLSTIFSESDDMPELVRIARTRQMTEQAKNYEILLEEYMS